MVDAAEIRARIEKLISEGKLLEAKTALKAINYVKLPRSQIADFANFARRVGSPELTLRVLYHVREPNPGDEPATPSEIAAYAMALGKTGATAEALRLFDSISGSPSAPEADLYFAFTLISQWQYRAAIPWLENYLKRKEPTAYQKAVAKSNLAVAYEYTGKIKKASQLVHEIAEAAQANSWTRLHMHALETSSQIALEHEIENSGGSKCEKLLAEAFELAGQHQLDTLVLEKWKAVLELSLRQNRAPLENVRKKATQLSRWEIVRDCDFQLALFAQDSALMSKVYFGTPFPSFRGRILQKSQDWFKPPDFYEWQLKAEPSQKIFDLLSGVDSSQPQKSGLRRLLLQLMRGLSSDFYRPLHVGNLHALIYPDDYFSPTHSPAKVRNLVTRLHAWFDKNDFPFRVTSTDMTYRLSADRSYGVRVYLDFESRSEKKVLSLLEKLRTRWPYKSFSSADAANELQVPSEEVLKLLKEEVALGRLYRSGRASSTLFRFRK